MTIFFWNVGEWRKLKSIIDLKMIIGEVILFILVSPHVMTYLPFFETDQRKPDPSRTILKSVRLMFVNRGIEDPRQ